MCVTHDTEEFLIIHIIAIKQHCNTFSVIHERIKENISQKNHLLINYCKSITMTFFTDEFGKNNELITKFK